MSIHTIRMPDIGEGIAEVEIVEWRVKVGDGVAEDQTLCEVMTDKAAVEVPSPAAGRVVELGGAIGQVMALGSVRIRIDYGSGAGEKVPAHAPPAQVAAVPPPSGQVGATPPSSDLPITPPSIATKPPTPGRMPPRSPASAAPTYSASSSTAPRALAAPAVRERARVLGVDLSRLNGSGPDGRIVHADLDATQSTVPRATTTTAAAPTDGTREVTIWPRIRRRSIRRPSG